MRLMKLTPFIFIEIDRLSSEDDFQEANKLLAKALKQVQEAYYAWRGLQPREIRMDVKGREGESR